MSTLRVNTVRNAAGSGQADAGQLGVGQTWQAVTRATGVTYTNSTGRPICLTLSGSAGSGSSTLTVAGVVVGTVTYNNTGGQLFAVIPAEATYSYSGISMNAVELR